MSGNLSKEVLLNATLGNPPNSNIQGDINQNFASEQTKLYQAATMRGLNNNKASPDSGWTFPGLIPPQLFPGIIPQPLNTQINSGEPSKLPQDFASFSADYRAATNQVTGRGNSMFPTSYFSEAYQKTLTPFMEMNLRQQQLLFENAMLIPQNPNPASNYMNFKSYDNFAASQSSISCDNNRTSLPTNHPIVAMSLKSTSVTGESYDRNNQFNRLERPIWNGMGANLTPVGTPATEAKHFQDNLMQPLVNHNNTANINLAQTALVTAQMTNYLNLLRQTSITQPPTNQDIILQQNSSPSIGFNLKTNNTFVGVAPTIPNISADIQKNMTNCNFKDMESSLKSPSYHNLTRPNALGNFNHTDVSRNVVGLPPYGFDPRLYQASSSSAPTTHVISHSAHADIPNERNSPRQPQRPNHIGSGFVPQTHLLSVNTNHGTQSSDKESIHSSTSPGRTSPYSSTGRHSRTPSPRGDRKGRVDNTCSICNKQFSSSSALAKHKLIHSDERKYVCHICSRGFKRQDHLNGHMITHREKKPYECHYPDCGKSYCDMRSLRRHLENHHSSPTGSAGSTGYMPKLSLYSGYAEENAQSHSYRHPPESSSSRLDVPIEPPRPSSAPLVVPPEPKRVTRTRRSSSGEESGVQLDPALVREYEMRRGSPYHRGIPDDYPKSVRATQSASPGSSHLLKTVSPHLPRSSAASVYDARSEYSRKLAEFERGQRILDSKRAEFDRMHPHEELKHTLSSERHKDYGKVKKQDFPPGGLPPGSSYPTGMPSNVMNQRFPWNPHYSQPGPSPSSANMPFLLNIRNPFSFSPRGYYPNQTETPNAENPKLSKSEHEARQQAMSTYLQMWANGQHSNLTPEQLFMYQNQNRFLQGQTPTDATAIAIAAAKENHDRTYASRDGLYGIHPTNAQWQQVMQDDSVTREKEPPKSSYYHHPTTSSVRPISREPIQRFIKEERNIIDEPFKPSETNHRDRYKYSPQSSFYDRNHQRLNEIPHPQADIFDRHHERPEQAMSLEPPRHRDISRSPHMFEQPIVTPQRDLMAKLFEPPSLRIETADSSPLSLLSPSKRRPRPGPIIIPPSLNNRTSTSPLRNLPRSIYTPPAMLSPKSIFFNPPGLTPRQQVVIPSTPGRLMLSVRRNSSIDQRETPLGKSNSVSSEEQVPVEIPEPKINVGVEFQAVLPAILDRSEAQKDIHKASLMWSPLKEDIQKYSEVNSYLEMACSLALYGGSNNKEYALHILQRTRGNVKEAVRLLLSRRHILRADDSNADYHYSGSVKWTSKERLAFRQAYRTRGKIFNAIQKEVVTKSVQLCVEFYYLWKAMHPESFRARTRMVEVESEQDDEEVPPTPTAAVAPLSTLREPVFECDYPECRARFVSRQALNGHIRVHGGSLTKPNEIRRPKQKSFNGNSVLDSSLLPSPPKKKRTATPSSVIVTNTGDGPQQQFQCKVCGRVFSKVKSRSAHMKTHVKRDDNNKPIKQNKQQKAQHLQQQRLHYLQQQKEQQQQQQAQNNHSMTVFAHA